MIAGLAFDSRLSRERLIVPAIVVPSFKDTHSTHLIKIYLLTYFKDLSQTLHCAVVGYLSHL